MNTRQKAAHAAALSRLRSGTLTHAAPRPAALPRSLQPASQRRAGYEDYVHAHARTLLALDPQKALSLAAAGRTNEQIAEDLGSSLDAVKTRLSAAYKELGVTTRAQAVDKALRDELIHLTEAQRLSYVRPNALAPTPQEVEVIKASAATSNGIRPDTPQDKPARSRLYRKWKVKTATELVVLAFVNGWS